MQVKEGLGDFIAAGLTVTPERAADMDFSRPYNHVSELLVAKTKADCPADVAGLAGRKVHVRPSSSYASTLASTCDGLCPLASPTGRHPGSSPGGALGRP